MVRHGRRASLQGSDAREREDLRSMRPVAAGAAHSRREAPARDVQGLRLWPDGRIAEAGLFDVLLVHGQAALMHDEEVLELIRKHVQRKKLLFSVCTGALRLRCGGCARRWSTRHLNAVLQSGSCGCGRWQPHQRCRRNGWAGCGAGAGRSLWEEMRLLRRSSSPLSMPLTPSFTAELPRARPLRCLRDFRKSTS